MDSSRIEDWLSARAESPKTMTEYLETIRRFSDYCLGHGKQFSQIVQLWRAAHYSGAREEQMFIDEWQDVIRAYATSIKSGHAPLTQKTLLTIPKSFFSFYKIPVDVDLPRSACVLYHNQDFTREQLRMILSKATQKADHLFSRERQKGNSESESPMAVSTHQQNLG